MLYTFFSVYKCVLGSNEWWYWMVTRDSYWGWFTCTVNKDKRIWSHKRGTTHIECGVSTVGKGEIKTHRRWPDFANTRVDNHGPYLGDVRNGVTKLICRRLKNGRLRGRYKIFHGSHTILCPFFYPFQLQLYRNMQSLPRYPRKSEGSLDGHILRITGFVVKNFRGRSAHAQQCRSKVGIFWKGSPSAVAQVKPSRSWHVVSTQCSRCWWVYYMQTNRRSSIATLRNSTQYTWCKMYCCSISSKSIFIFSSQIFPGSWQRHGCGKKRYSRTAIKCFKFERWLFHRLWHTYNWRPVYQ